MTRRPWLRRPSAGTLRGAALLGAAGALHALTFAPGPLPAWSLALIQILTLAVAAHATLRAPTLRAAFARGWWFSSFSFSLGLYWLFVSMHRYGGMAVPLAVGGVLALSLFLAIFPGMACAAARWLCPPRVLDGVALRARQALWAAATWGACWAFFEWVRATLWTGFPWLNIGYAHVDGPLAGWAPILGVHGMALFAAFAAAALAGLWRAEHADVAEGSEGAERFDARHGLAFGVAMVFVLAGWLLGLINWSRPTGEPVSVRLVQGNVEQSQKFEPALLQQGLLRHLELAALPAAAGVPAPQLIILPETVLPVFQDQLDPRIWEAWREVAARQQATIAMGVPLHTRRADGSPSYTNSVLGFDANTPVAQLATGTTAMRYDKQHLVPWGEYVPPGFRWFVEMLDIPLGDFDSGPPRQKPFAVAGQHIAFNICYEDLFGPELLPALLPGPDGQPGATILVNVSNLGWFGDTWALRQHMQIGRLRTIETARPMLTATNTGLTAAIDARGHVAAQLPAHQPGVLPVSVQGMTGLTPYARWDDKLALALIGLVLIAAAGRGRYNRRP
ncbi:apolipoprotein N-acyltransferase [Bordetella genomosp. 5]|uniref:Apolipoprotein N-acyltransferase n=1 Tax=Bordetella genomosp. 5 TaxID=1395608 RepID=A0A261T7Y7_9BORD|nr:apolipoprotein N-acyltransferase [Bordetella genomosp. 5]OZI45719.1 apolipoprotein N-acyltransferase [Bordetella genomosp. 5]